MTDQAMFDDGDDPSRDDPSRDDLSDNSGGEGRDAESGPERRKQTGPRRVFLVLVDNTPEMSRALRFACGRAKRTGGRVALLHVIEPAEIETWMSVGDIMREENRLAAEKLLNDVSGEVVRMTGEMPIINLREGKRQDELLRLINEDEAISILVIASSTDKKGPGPILSYLSSKMASGLRLPFTVVPGSLSDEEIDALI
ncbi:MAG: universal stress protein [Alphaproteobacteria bacterium]|nr:universal stress protein [Alphaproteobacteria bacterium]